MLKTATSNETQIFVSPYIDKASQLIFRGRQYKCSIGYNGAKLKKREGDGTTPVGNFLIRKILYRPDRIDRPISKLPTKALSPIDAWCDDPSHDEYNRMVKLPFSGSYELLWRKDNLYDVILVIGYNDNPARVPYGSAIFMHCSTRDYKPTKGCIALAKKTLISILPHITKKSSINIMQY